MHFQRKGFDKVSRRKTSKQLMAKSWNQSKSHWERWFKISGNDDEIQQLCTIFIGNSIVPGVANENLENEAKSCLAVT